MIKIQFENKTKLRFIEENPNLITPIIFGLLFIILAVIANKLIGYIFFGLLVLIEIPLIYYSFADTLTYIGKLEIDNNIVKIEIYKKDKLSEKLDLDLSFLDLKFTEIYRYKQPLIRLDFIFKSKIVAKQVENSQWTRAKLIEVYKEIRTKNNKPIMINWLEHI